MARRQKTSKRKHCGRVSYFPHHGSWYVYYRDGAKKIRKRVSDNESDAEKIAAQVNAQLTSNHPTLLGFDAINIPELRDAFLNYHQCVIRSSHSTVKRYQSATEHLLKFAKDQSNSKAAHQINVEKFVVWLRSLLVSPNGHNNSVKRPLRDKGLIYVLQVCRSLYSYAAKNRHLPPYFENPFSKIQIDRMRIDNAKPIFIFDAQSELEFFRQSDTWTFPVHFTLAKTGLRSGEIIHALIEELDLKNGWLKIKNKPELGWQIKTRRERKVPLIKELVDVLRIVVGSRTSGPIFIRHKFLEQDSPLREKNQTELFEAFEKRIREKSGDQFTASSSSEYVKIASSIWRDAGAINSDRIRRTFIRTCKKSGLQNVSCPKSWRHTFATLLQDANIDPLVRQVTLGHKPTNDAKNGLGMTGVYTHTRSETQKREIEKALRLWPNSLRLARDWVSAASNRSR